MRFWVLLLLTVLSITQMTDPILFEPMFWAFMSGMLTIMAMSSLLEEIQK